MSVSDIKLGALCRNQHASWPELLEAGGRANQLGYDTLWTWDKWLGSRSPGASFRAMNS